MARNKEYWIARALQRENEAYLRGVGLTAKMFQEYDRAAKAIRREIGDFYSKYAGKYGLTYDQAVRLLTRKEFQEWKATLAEYVARIAQEPDPRVKAILTAQLDALSTNSRISRLEALLGQIDLKLNDLWETGVAQMKAEFGDAFREGYYKKIFDIQSRVGFFHEIAKTDYKNTNPLKVFEDVYKVIADRKVHPKEGSYTNYLFDKGIDKILKKLGEEATEIVIAAKNPNPNEVKYEISDFLYHMMVLMAEKDVTWEEITTELANR